jgi:hypothetical protein
MDRGSSVRFCWRSKIKLRDLETKPEFQDARARAEACKLKGLQELKDRYTARSGDWKSVVWDMQKFFPKQFGDDPRLAIFAQQNNYQLSDEDAKEIRTGEQRLSFEIYAMLEGKKEINGNGKEH